tara:strand:+ start:1218 stop:2000 length:783 start_codon:yes stop_codon:yes gene_type:complete
MTHFDHTALMNASAFLRRSAIVRRFADRIACHKTPYAATIACSYVYENAATGRRMNRTSVMRAVDHLVSRSTGYRITARLLDAGWLTEDNGVLVTTPRFLEEFECFIGNLAVLGQKTLAFESASELFDCTLWYDAQTFEYLFAENTEHHIGWETRDLIGRQIGVLGHPDYVSKKNYGFATCVRAVPSLPTGSIVMSNCVARHKMSGTPVFFAARLTSGTMGAKQAVVAQIKLIDHADWIAANNGVQSGLSQFETQNLQSD